MKTAGLREARQNFAALVEEVRKGHEVEITDRGRPVARLVPVEVASHSAFTGRAAFRRAMPVVEPPLSTTLSEEREDRI
jgi:prevent-host-death family protein